MGEARNTGSKTGNLYRRTEDLWESVNCHGQKTTFLGLQCWQCSTRKPWRSAVCLALLEPRGQNNIWVYSETPGFIHILKFLEGLCPSDGLQVEEIPLPKFRPDFNYFSFRRPHPWLILFSCINVAISPQCTRSEKGGLLVLAQSTQRQALAWNLEQWQPEKCLPPLSSCCSSVKVLPTPNPSFSLTVHSSHPTLSLENGQNRVKRLWPYLSRWLHLMCAMGKSTPQSVSEFHYLSVHTVHPSSAATSTTCADLTASSYTHEGPCTQGLEKITPMISQQRLDWSCLSRHKGFSCATPSVFLSFLSSIFPATKLFHEND